MQSDERHDVTSRRRLIAAGAAYAAGLTIAIALAAVALERLVAVIANAAGEPRAADSRLQTAVVVGHQVLNDEWQRSLTSESTWRERSNAAAPGLRGVRQSPSYLQGPPQPPGWIAMPPPGNPWFIPPGQFPQRGQPGHEPKAHSRATGYRAVCVRQCDGFFFPMSYGGSEGNSARDQTRCSEACPGSRVYYYRPGSEDADDMVDSLGQPYSKLKTANLFRTQYVEACKCKPHPWEQASVDRHRVYALEDQRRKGNHAVAAELEDLRSKQRTDVREVRRQAMETWRVRANRNDVPVVQAQPATPASLAPRSDASRGQSPDQGASAPAAVATGSIVAAGAGQSRVQTAALPVAPVPGAPSVTVDVPVVGATPAPAHATQPEPAPNSAPPVPTVGTPEAASDPPVAAKVQTPKRKGRSSASKQRITAVQLQVDRRQRVAGGLPDWVRRAYGQ